MAVSKSFNPSSRHKAWKRLVAANPPAWVLDHALAVEGLAVAMAMRAKEMGLSVDVELVSLGALLHDIGRSVTQDLHHAHVGADLLRQPPPWPEPVCRIAETHTGAGLTPEDAKSAGLPPRDYMPTSLEERIVAHADNLHSGPRRLLLAEVLSKYQAKGLPEAAARIELLHATLGPELGCDLDQLEAVDLQAPDVGATSAS